MNALNFRQCFETVYRRQGTHPFINKGSRLKT